jgi:PAS domain S-box-containing protein
MSAEDIQKLVHELQVHQVELKIQNEELRQAQQDLAQARDRYMSLYHSAPVGYLTLDRRRTIQQCNQAAATMLGIPCEHLIGSGLEKLVFADDADACYVHLRRAADSGIRQAQELRLARPDGTHIWAALDTIFTGREEPQAGYRVALRDITELREARDELERRVKERTAELSASVETMRDEVARRTLAERALRHRSEQLRALASELTLAEQHERQRLAQILHDGLQQLLVGAKFYLAALERSRDKTVREQAAEVNELLSDSIETSRLLTAELCPPILREAGLVPALEWLTRWMLDKHGLEVSLTAQGGIGTIAEDVAVLLFQATRELLFNAVKHSGAGSAAVTVALTEDRLVIAVADEGAGFDPAQLRAEGGPSEGFGLFAIRERLDWLGGRMEIDSAPGRGSRFAMEVPLTGPARGKVLADQRAKVSVVITPPGGGEGLGKIRIVLVDDHIVMRQGLATLLRDEPGMAIVGEASDGESAVKLVRDVHPDIVLMDVSMPGMNGIEATRIIHGELPDVRVIGLSMFEEGQRAGAMLQAGAVKYLTKSDAADKLVAAIRACAEAHPAEWHGRNEPEA